MKTTTIADACELHARIGWQGLTKNEYLDSGDYYLVTGVDFDNGRIDFRNCHYVTKARYDQDPNIQLKYEDVLVTKDGTIGKVAIIDKALDRPATLNSGVFVVRPKNSDELLPRFLVYVLLSKNFIRFIENIKVGCTIAHLNQEKFLKFRFPLPSIEEQQKIIDVFDRLVLLITARKNELIKMDELIKARFVEMFGDPILNQKGFPVYRMDEVVEFQGGSQPDKKYFEYEPTENNIRLIQIRDYKTDKYITYIPKSLAKRFCTADDIMIGRYGPPIFQILQGIEGSFNVALMKATPKMGNREFIRYFLKQECLLNYLEGMSQRTAGQDGIQMDKLKSYPFPMPPIELQNEFEQFVKIVNQSKTIIQKSIVETQELFDSLMQKYFG